MEISDTARILWGAAHRRRVLGNQSGCPLYSVIRFLKFGNVSLVGTSSLRSAAPPSSSWGSWSGRDVQLRGGNPLRSSA